MKGEEAGSAASAPTEIEQDKFNDSVIIDIPVHLEFELWSKSCIQRVPRKLRKVKEAAYTPQLLSIGPFHHGKTELLGMEHHKRRYFDVFCRRTGKKQADLKHFIRGHHEEILQSYAGTVEFRKEVFLDIVLIDACFILELFLRNSENREDDYILKTPWLRKDIEQDLILLENQLPYAFLKQLYDFVATPEPHSEATRDSGTENDKNPELVPLLSTQHHNKNESFHPFSKHTRDFFSYARHAEAAEVDAKKHFTDLVRQALCPKKTLPSENNISNLYSATKLDLAGVRLISYQNSRLTELEMVSGRFSFCCIPCISGLKSTQLKLPEFEIQDDTECLLRNVMALEQCQYPYEAYICNYILLLDQLIDDTKDVDLLVEKKIVRNLLGSNEFVAKLINKLCDQIVVTNSCYYEVSEELNALTENCCIRTKAMIKRVYFKDCWTASSAIVGFFVLVFSVSATIKALFFK